MQTRTASRGDDLIIIALGLWLTVGLFLDGYSHGKLAPAESFFTPWHALLHSGFLANAFWMLRPVWRAVRAGKPWLAGVPAGYAGGVTGVVVFGLGGIGDMLWHTLRGVETGGEALFSPPHLLLFMGGVLILSTPFRAAWVGTTDTWRSLRDFLPTLISLTLALCFVSFFFMYMWGFFSTEVIGVGSMKRLSIYAAPTHDALRLMETVARARAIGMILFTTVMLLAPVLLMLRRWRIPFGSVTILFVTIAVLMAPIASFAPQDPVIVVALAGGVADWLVQRLRPSPARIAQFRIFATLVPLVMWSLHFLIVRLRWGIEWPVELWGGVILWTGVTGLGLSVIMVPEGSRS